MAKQDVDEVDELEEDLEVLEDDDLAVDELEDEIDDELAVVVDEEADDELDEAPVAAQRSEVPLISDEPCT